MPDTCSEQSLTHLVLAMPPPDVLQVTKKSIRIVQKIPRQAHVLELLVLDRSRRLVVERVDGGVRETRAGSANASR